ncbi:MAG: DUF3592 domain-containing protein [Planctomycetes bacterium]|nr:DUF3592 domain-containing protein [Planctomycetota bacterium]
MTSFASNTAISARRNSGFSGCFLWIFGGIFFSVGAVATFFMTVSPLRGMYQARNWTATPCEIVSSTLQGEDDSKQLVVVYKYSFENQEYQSSRYCFHEIATNTSPGWKRKVLAAHRPGTQTTCYVNPGAPAEAVIERGWVPDMWWCLFPLPFLVVGGGILIFATRGTSATPERSLWRHNPSPFEDLDSADDDVDTGPVTLKPEVSPVQMLIGAIVVAVFWNGIVSIFVWQISSEFLQGKGIEWFPTLFLIPFVLVGLGLVCFILYSLLALFNPRPTLVVNTSAIPLGEKLSVQWSLSGRTESIRELKITLTGIEKATYRRGTTTATDTSTFENLVIVETTEPFDMEQGTASVTIPADTMHSFDAAHNKIAWTLTVRGEIPWWPDVSASFPIVVLPIRRHE